MFAYVRMYVYHTFQDDERKTSSDDYFFHNQITQCIDDIRTEQVNEVKMFSCIKALIFYGNLCTGHSKLAILHLNFTNDDELALKI